MTAQQPTARSRASWAIILGVIAGLLAVAIGLAVYLGSLRPAAAPTPSGPTAATPAEAVRGYLDALVAGRAADALSFAAAQPADTSLLTDQVLTASQKLKPLTVVTVGTVEGSGNAVVPVTVRQADRTREWQVPVIFTARGWRLSKVTSEVTLDSIPAGLNVTLNGQALPAGPTATVFPGAYQVADSLAEIDLRDKPLIVDAPGTVFNVELSPVLTNAGKKKLRALALDSLKTCLAQRSINPKGCPNVAAAAKGQTVIDKTVRWSVQGDPWAKASYDVSAVKPTEASGKATFTFRLVCSLKQDGATYQIDQTIPYPVLFTADLAEQQPTIVWQRL